MGLASRNFGYFTLASSQLSIESEIENYYNIWSQSTQAYFLIRIQPWPKKKLEHKNRTKIRENRKKKIKQIFFNSAKSSDSSSFSALSCQLLALRVCLSLYLYGAECISYEIWRPWATAARWAGWLGLVGYRGNYVIPNWSLLHFFPFSFNGKKIG